MTHQFVAAIDLGTNTTRLLITDGVTDVVREAHITGLGRGLSETGSLAREAVGRVVEALERFRLLLDTHGVDASSIGAIATSAARDAANADEFFDTVERVLGVRPMVVSGDTEAELGFAGATAGLDTTGTVLVVDIGGGSTEFSLGSADGATATLHGGVSVDMGSVRFTEAYVEHDPPRPEELSAILSVVDAHLDDVIRDLPGIGGVGTVLAVAGTATTVAAVEIGLIDYDPDVIDGFVLEREAAEDVFRTLATESLADRVHNPGLQAERADVIVAGTAILVGIMRHLGLDEVVVRERDILDGIAASVRAGRLA